jgi:hypothetical protein
MDLEKSGNYESERKALGKLGNIVSFHCFSTFPSVGKLGNIAVEIFGVN